MGDQSAGQSATRHQYDNPERHGRSSSACFGGCIGVASLLTRLAVLDRRFGAQGGQAVLYRCSTKQAHTECFRLALQFVLFERAPRWRGNHYEQLVMSTGFMSCLTSSAIRPDLTFTSEECAIIATRPAHLYIYSLCPPLGRMYCPRTMV